MKVGDRYGRLTLLEYVKLRHKMWGWKCQCDCGEFKNTPAHYLRAGRVKSCGCLHRETSAKNCRDRGTHGQSIGGVTKEYRAHQGMKNRCLNSNTPAYKDYGGRGITVCPRWLDGENGKSGFECFFADMGVSPKGSFLDRIDSNGMYEPSNCRWVTALESNRNKRNIRITEDLVVALRNGEKTDKEVAAITGMTIESVYQIRRGRRWRL